MKYLVTLLFASLVFISCGKGASKQTEASSVSNVVSVKTMPAVQQTVDVIEEFTGSILPYAQNNIGPSMGLRIEGIRVKVGDRVSRGQLLVEMDRRQLLQSQIQQSTLENDFNRLDKLYQEGGVSKQQLDQITAQLSVTRQATSSLKENTELRSPISGIVTDRFYDPGDVYSPAVGRILTVMQIDRVKVLVNVSERFFTKVKVGMNVAITLEVFPEDTLSGKVSLIYPSLDAQTRSFRVEVTIENQNMKVRPGMYGRVYLNFGKAEAVLVPDISVQKQIGTNERFLFVEKGGVVFRRVVRIGRVVNKNFEILEGVFAGENIVVAGSSKLVEGTKVKVVK